MADLSSFVQDSTSGLFIPPQARRNVLPWDDLQALATPERLSQLSPDLISALSVLVAQGPKVPFLLTTDEHSALRVVAEINNSSTIARANAVGDRQVMVTDPKFVGPGDVFVTISAAGGGASGPYQVSGSGQDTDGTIHITTNLSSSVAVGDGARRLPLVSISGFGNQIQARRVPYDWQQQFTGSGAILNGGQFTLQVDMLSVTATQNAAPGAAYAGTVTLTDQTLGFPIVVVSVGLPAVGGQAFVWTQAGLGLFAYGVGNPISVTVAPALGANQSIEISASGYLV